jgi:hypothetical protein
MPQPRVPTSELKARGAYIKHPERKRANEPPRTGEDLRDSEPDKDLSREEKAVWRDGRNRR